MRGKATAPAGMEIPTRITPAYAGKRLKSIIIQFPFWDHPRLCGEKLKFIDEKILRQGSPPPMRGKVRLLYHRGEFFMDHPRLCGEKSSIHPQNYTLKGSPPPMRGKDESSRIANMNDRITPAYAGKRNAVQLLKGFRRDHPRLCGEKSRNHVDPAVT